MIKKLLLGFVLLLVGAAGALWFIGSGELGKDWQSSPVVTGPRPTTEPAGKSDEISPIWLDYQGE
jgi:hypothetical protein